ncbi:hypothetical protein [Acinetobacter schindleri]|uniref:hypothetical protein n=1 Tax=Acinetobacter schindleri TaxID=108981 RepID=UPI002FE2C9D1
MEYFSEFDGKKWEDFCEIVIRNHFTPRYFTSVPSLDSGDCGIEFFTKEGSIYQCYFPNPQFSMSEFKTHVQDKIRDDLKKLSTYEDTIATWLDGIKVHQWVLLIPEIRSKDLLNYCNKYKKNTISKNLTFIDNSKFDVKVETPQYYSKAFIHALKYQNSEIHISVKNPETTDIFNFQQTELDLNIQRKSKIISNTPEKFSKNMTSKYLSMQSFLDELRNYHPDTYYRVEECGRMLLEKMQDLIEIDGLEPNVEFIKVVKTQNEQEIQIMFNEVFSRINLNQLSYGFISKWIAECNMDFIYE